MSALDLTLALLIGVAATPAVSADKELHDLTHQVQVDVSLLFIFFLKFNS